MKNAIPLATAFVAVMLVSGCANRQPSSAEIRIQSTPAPGALAVGSTPAPFCLHIRYANAYEFGVMTHNDAQAWVMDGDCATAGARRAVAAIDLRWRYQYDSTGSQGCVATDSCAIADRNYGEGRRLACVAATARDPGWVASGSTDWHACAR
ncbi:MAG: hypothetical protein KA795_08620 [Burkholderiaceae bacterium]|nr:hypothetical protein [Burkholderiaceae bacterium]